MATIQGPGDLAAINLKACSSSIGGDNQNWTISNIRFLDFDLAIGMFNGAGGTDAFNGTHITNNYIRIARDLNATVAPADANQNIGIHLLVRHEPGHFWKHDRDPGQWRQRLGQRQFRQRRRHAEQHQRRRGL